jgi:hypothetical protein
MPMLPDLPTVEKATFKVLEGTGAGGEPMPVQFNPASLEYTLSNEFDDKGSNAARQFVKKTSGKLTMTLIYDTTDTGGDVREQTEKISRLLEPAKDGTKKFAPKVEFGWGTYTFKGVVEQYKETIDFFAPSGVPLRASLNLTLSSQEVEFQSNKNPPATVDGDLSLDPVSAPQGAAASDVANAMGDPRAARAIAGANGAASLRFGGSASLSVGGEISLSAAASFSAGASLGVGVGVGVGVSAGLSAAPGAGLSIEATAGEAFVGLRVSPPAIGGSVAVGDARAALLPAPGVSGAASFGPGGRARVQSGRSLSADVGAGADIHARIGFD